MNASGDLQRYKTSTCHWAEECQKGLVVVAVLFLRSLWGMTLSFSQVLTLPLWLLDLPYWVCGHLNSVTPAVICSYIICTFVISQFSLELLFNVVKSNGWRVHVCKDVGHDLLFKAISSDGYRILFLPAGGIPHWQWWFLSSFVKK